MPVHFISFFLGISLYICIWLEWVITQKVLSFSQATFVAWHSKGAHKPQAFSHFFFLSSFTSHTRWEHLVSFYCIFFSNSFSFSVVFFCSCPGILAARTHMFHTFLFMFALWCHFHLDIGQQLLSFLLISLIPCLGLFDLIIDTPH